MNFVDTANYVTEKAKPPLRGTTYVQNLNSENEEFHDSQFSRLSIERVFNLKFEKDSPNKQQNLPDVINVSPANIQRHRWPNYLTYYHANLH